MTLPRVLSIAGTDPTGGAGIHADLKSIAAVGGFGMAAVTSLVAQNTHGVRSVHTPPSSFLREQLDAVSDDVVIDAVKIGMLGDTATVAVVADWLGAVRPPVVVLDPVMVATSGDRLLDDSAEEAVRNLMDRADLVTPNLDELAVLTGSGALTWDDALEQGRRLADAHDVRVLVKGGHAASPDCPDALVTPGGEAPFVVRGERIDTTATHGTGCSLSSALATLRVSRGDWEAALTRAKEWLADAIRHGSELRVGSGHGPIHHFHELYESAGRATPAAPGLPADSAATPDEGAEPDAAAAPDDWRVVVTPPAGPETAALWRACEPVRRQIDELQFVTSLADGTLSDEEFSYYLAQDAMYLGDYSRALARASEIAPTTGEQEFWAKSAYNAIAEESQLHRTWLAGRPAEPARGRVTDSYTALLLDTAAGTSYACLTAVVLPCFWIYQDVGSRLHARRTADHPYREWLDMYADPDFAESVATALGYAETALAGASRDERAAAADAFAQAAMFEREFFAAPAERETADRRPGRALD